MSYWFYRKSPFLLSRCKNLLKNLHILKLLCCSIRSDRLSFESIWCQESHQGCYLANTDCLFSTILPCSIHFRIADSNHTTLHFLSDLHRTFAKSIAFHSNNLFHMFYLNNSLTLLGQFLGQGPHYQYTIDIFLLCCHIRRNYLKCRKHLKYIHCRFRVISIVGRTRPEHRYLHGNNQIHTKFLIRFGVFMDILFQLRF